jgi:hypothetical protein
VNEETYVGPCSLREALDAAEELPGSMPTGVRVAVSTPEGWLIAIQFPGGNVEIRHANRISGRTGSVMDTGEWLQLEDVEEFLNGRGSWRPA